MRKILLATTAIVALSAGSAMASDITISGSFEFGHTSDSGNSNSNVADDGTAYYAEQDVNINFSSTTDSGITMSMSMGIDENDATDDTNASLSGDFGTIMFAEADDASVLGMDIDVDGATSEEGASAADAATYAGGFSGVTGTSLNYTLPTLVEGLTITGSHANGAADAESYGFGARYTMSAAGASVTLATATSSSNTGTAGDSDVDRNHYGIQIVSGDITIMGESNTMTDPDVANSDYSSTGVGATYKMGAMTLGAYNRTASTGTAAQDYSQTAYGIDYTVAAGLTASVTVTSTDTSSTVSNDRTAMALKMAF